MLKSNVFLLQNWLFIQNHFWPIKYARSLEYPQIVVSDSHIRNRIQYRGALLIFVSNVAYNENALFVYVLLHVYVMLCIQYIIVIWIVTIPFVFPTLLLLVKHLPSSHPSSCLSHTLVYTFPHSPTLPTPVVISPHQLFTFSPRYNKTQLLIDSLNHLHAIIFRTRHKTNYKQNEN